MKQLLMCSLVAVLITACGQDQADESGETAAAATSAAVEAKPTSSGTREPKWVVDIEGLPEVSGRRITAIGSIDGGVFSFARKGFTSSISLSDKGEISHMTMKYGDQNVRCLDYGDVIAAIDDTRLELSGEVLCGPERSDESEKHAAKINAWIETKK